jgi:peroxiredoxin
LIFFNPGCGFCQNMVPDLAALPVDGTDGSPVPVLVTTGGVERNREMLQEFRGPVLIQEQMEVAATYEAHGTPMGYLLDEEGEIASPIAVGAQALLALADGKQAALFEANGNGHRSRVGNRDLSQSRINRSGLAPGTPAPDFRLPLLGGGELSLGELRGRKVLLVFSDPHCGPCEALLPRLQAALGVGVWGFAPDRVTPNAQRRTPNAALQVVVVSRGEADENREKAKRHGLNFPVVLQKKWEVSKLYAMFATPVAYLINEEGVIAAEVATGPEPILDLARSATAAAAPAPAERGAPEPALAGAVGRNGSTEEHAGESS